MIMGSDATGVIVEIGENVTGYNNGDDVIIQPGVYNPDCATISLAAAITSDLLFGQWNAVNIKFGNF